MFLWKQRCFLHQSVKKNRKSQTEPHFSYNPPGGTRPHFSFARKEFNCSYLFFYPKICGGCFAWVHQKGPDPTDSSWQHRFVSQVFSRYWCISTCCYSVLLHSWENALLVCPANTLEMSTDLCVSTNKAGIAETSNLLETSPFCQFFKSQQLLGSVLPTASSILPLQWWRMWLPLLHLPSYTWRSSASSDTCIWAAHLEESQSLMGNCPSPVCYKAGGTPLYPKCYILAYY